ncbi:MAG: SH3 domain-containing protein [Chryseobacterium sp.]|uniref:SH3 domain-containing protein n=1 Tax=Chryseobacterium sp. TaxID=1871047 RepID=UPI0025C24700|nr:SH3 domain-containing protein [Chryseobacterium sp.]MCJ7933896.1 SH3 domain-containing protein [Chryseobacterium sp.]
MKTFISIFIICFGAFVSDSFSSLQYEENELHGGRCTGSAACTACSNCSGCKHCKSGGTCGVCKGSSSGKSSSAPSSKKVKSKYTSGLDHFIENSKTLSKPESRSFAETGSTNNSIVTSRAVSIFEKPSLQSKVIKTVAKNTPLVTISKDDFWYKVKVPEAEKTGFIRKADAQ